VGNSRDHRGRTGRQTEHQQGSILDLPLSDGYAEAILCTDVLGLIENLPRAVAECARVLEPGGAMISYVTVATDRMAAFEQAELDASQGTRPAWTGWLLSEPSVSTSPYCENRPDRLVHRVGC
jgi:ubiquinone/menaquinone biosynthesis C-methylase UbiE